MAAPAQATLSELVRQGLAIDPTVSATAAQARAAQERVVQARAAFGPTVSITGSYQKNNYFEEPLDNLRQFHSDQTALQVTVPLWRGALFPALDSAKAQWLQAQAALVQAQAESVQRIVEAAFEMLKARDTLAFSRAQQVASAEQLLTARRAYEQGTVPITDVRDAEAKSDVVAAQVIAAEADLSMRRQVLAELAGRDAAELLPLGLDGSDMPKLASDTLAQWLGDVADTSPQIQQSRLALEATEHEVRKAWQAHMPTVDLSYSYSRGGDTGTLVSVFPRRGAQGTLGVNVNVPLFASGATQSKVREADALREKAQADVDGARRTVALAVRQAFTATVSAVAQARGLETAVRSQEAAVRANRRSYEVGVKVNYEVLDAQSKLFEARRDLSKARYEAWAGFLKLKTQAGQLRDEELEHLDALLVRTPEPEFILPRRSVP